MPKLISASINNIRAPSQRFNHYLLSSQISAQTNKLSSGPAWHGHPSACPPMEPPSHPHHCHKSNQHIPTQCTSTKKQRLPTCAPPTQLEPTQSTTHHQHKRHRASTFGSNPTRIHPRNVITSQTHPSRKQSQRCPHCTTYTDGASIAQYTHQPHKLNQQSQNQYQTCKTELTQPKAHRPEACTSTAQSRPPAASAQPTEHAPPTHIEPAQPYTPPAQTEPTQLPISQSVLTMVGDQTCSALCVHLCKSGCFAQRQRTPEFYTRGPEYKIGFLHVVGLWG